MSKNEMSSADEKAMLLAQKINSLLSEYYEKSLQIKTSLAKQTSEDDLDWLNHLINEREDIIIRYNEVKRELDTNSVQSKPDLEQLLAECKALVKLIETVDKENSVKINQLYDAQKAKIKQINQGKKVFNAYNTAVSQIDGVFFDKRK